MLTVALLLGFLPANADDVYDFFKAYLNGKASTYTSSSKKLKPKDVQRSLVNVWKSWKRALAKTETDTMHHMTRDSMTFSGKWRVPPELEPNATLNFTYFSKGNRPSTGYPLIVYLHGSGPRATEYSTGLTLTRGFKDAPCVYFVPQIPNEGGYYRWWQRGKVWAWKRLLRNVMALGDIDPDKIYFMGISEGAYGTQRLTSFFADYLAGGAALAGGEPLKNAPPENYANTAFMLMTGDHDSGFYRNTLTQYTAEALDRLAQAHPGLYTHDVRLIEGKGHSLDYSVASPWLVKHKRNPYSKYVAWEDFKMDDCRRGGFYNIWVNSSPNDDDDGRTFYEETISGDTINLVVDTVDYTTAEKDKVWGIEMRFSKKFNHATHGSLTIYLNRALVDLDHRITVIVNGKMVYNGRPEENIASMVNSCARYGDRRRIFTAQIDVEIGK